MTLRHRSTSLWAQPSSWLHPAASRRSVGPKGTEFGSDSGGFAGMWHPHLRRGKRIAACMPDRSLSGIRCRGQHAGGESAFSRPEARMDDATDPRSGFPPREPLPCSVHRTPHRRRSASHRRASAPGSTRRRNRSSISRAGGAAWSCGPSVCHRKPPFGAERPPLGHLRPSGCTSAQLLVHQSMTPVKPRRSIGFRDAPISIENFRFRCYRTPLLIFIPGHFSKYSPGGVTEFWNDGGRPIRRASAWTDGQTQPDLFQVEFLLQGAQRGILDLSRPVQAQQLGPTGGKRLAAQGNVAPYVRRAPPHRSRARAPTSRPGRGIRVPCRRQSHLPAGQSRALR